jgi:hypothetical protein
VIEDVSVGVWGEGVEIFVGDLVMQPGEEIVGTDGIRCQRRPQFVHLIWKKNMRHEHFV